MIEEGFTGKAFWIHKPSSRFFRPAKVEEVNVQSSTPKWAVVELMVQPAYYYHTQRLDLYTDESEALLMCADYNFGEALNHVRILNEKLQDAHREQIRASVELELRKRGLQ